MYVRATRGVCVGVADNMNVGDVRDLDDTLAKFLVSIGAVVKCDAPKQPEPAPATVGKKEK